MKDERKIKGNLTLLASNVDRVVTQKRNINQSNLYIDRRKKRKKGGENINAYRYSVSLHVTESRAAPSLRIEDNSSQLTQISHVRSSSCTNYHPRENTFESVLFLNGREELRTKSVEQHFRCSA